MNEPAHDATIHVTRFHLYRLDPVTLEWALMAEIPRSATSFQDPSPNDGRNWHYKVTALIK